MEELRKEAAREIKSRQWVYGRKDYKSLAERDLDVRRMAMMVAIEKHFAELAEKERLI